MKKKYLTLFVLAASIFLFANYTIIKVAGSHPGSTGAPGELTCAQVGCHSDAQVISNAVANNTVIFSNSDSTYIPGQLCTLTVQVQGSPSNPISRFGFELVALKDNDSLNVGQFGITDLIPLKTQIITHPQGTDLRYSVTHKSAGTPAISTNFDRWVFSWTAPPVNEGNITFWYATLAANNDGLNTGDEVYLHSFKIHPTNISSIKEIASEYNLKTYFDYDSKEISINYDLKGQRDVQLLIYDMAGKQIYVGQKSKLSGIQKQKIQIDNNYSAGTYLIQLNINNQKVTKKVLIN